ncbi:hypothetical protein Vadar_018587 [Vaccinium darrowii]|nr:hypothetical protein Vadar_018587 [Vaccinium darrowii]
MQLFEKYSKEVEVLKEEVKDMLVVNDAGGGKSASEKMVLIDALERLGVSYLFEKEIEENLEDMFKNFEDNSHVFHDDLFMVSLHFRVFRQHGYNLSSSIFKKFTNGNGVFKETICNDMMGMLSLYEATYLKVHGEDILDEAFHFTKVGLESLKPHLSPHLGEHVTHALYQPLHRDIPRLQARYYISFYENDPSRNEKLLRLAKIDFNRLQMLHKQELSDLIRWWKDLDIRPHIPYARDRIVECFLSGVSNYFEPQYAFPRSIHSKSMILISAFDDTYDAYGTYEELRLFTNAVQRWDDMDAIDRLPTYMKGFYAAVQKFFGQLHEEMSKQEQTYAVRYLEEAVPPSEWLNRACWDVGVGSTSPTVLKRKRPARLDIPVMSGWGGGLETSAVVERREEVEVEVKREGWYSVYCKRGKREAMEDWYSTIANN